MFDVDELEIPYIATDAEVMQLIKTVKRAKQHVDNRKSEASRQQPGFLEGFLYKHVQSLSKYDHDQVRRLWNGV